jgi:hypothetical protein
MEILVIANIHGLTALGPRASGGHGLAGRVDRLPVRREYPPISRKIVATNNVRTPS